MESQQEKSKKCARNKEKKKERKKKHSYRGDQIILASCWRQPRCSPSVLVNILVRSDKHAGENTEERSHMLVGSDKNVRQPDPEFLPSPPMVLYSRQ